MIRVKKHREFSKIVIFCSQSHWQFVKKCVCFLEVLGVLENSRKTSHISKFISYIVQKWALHYCRRNNLCSQCFVRCIMIMFYILTNLLLPLLLYSNARLCQKHDLSTPSSIINEQACNVSATGFRRVAVSCNFSINVSILSGLTTVLLYCLKILFV